MASRAVIAASLVLAALLPVGCASSGDAPDAGRTVTLGAVSRVLDRGTDAAAVSSPAALRRARAVAVPILMYHVISAPKQGAPYPELWLDERRFAAQVDALAAAGFEAVTLDQVHDAWASGSPLPKHPVVLSFDDGYLSDLTHAAPALRRHGWPGVLNLEVKNVDLPGGLSRRQVRRLIADGWEIDSHTIDHLDVTTLDAAGLRREIGESRRWLRRVFGVPVNFFCYPAGRFDAAAQAAVRAAGYRGATTELPGAARAGDDRTALPRIRVNGSDSPAAVLAKVRAA